MPYLIDGHNLIPKLAGFSLSAMDDEMQLIPLLQTFSRVRRQPVEVYFDRAPAGHAGARRFGTRRAPARAAVQGAPADQTAPRKPGRAPKTRGAARPAPRTAASSASASGSRPSLPQKSSPSTCGRRARATSPGEGGSRPAAA